MAQSEVEQWVDERFSPHHKNLRRMLRNGTITGILGAQGGFYSGIGVGVGVGVGVGLGGAASFGIGAGVAIGGIALAYGGSRAYGAVDAKRDKAFFERSGRPSRDLHRGRMRFANRDHRTGKYFDDLKQWRAMLKSADFQKNEETREDIDALQSISGESRDKFWIDCATEKGWRNNFSDADAMDAHATEYVGFKGAEFLKTYERHPHRMTILFHPEKLEETSNAIKVARYWSEHAHTMPDRDWLHERGISSDRTGVAKGTLADEILACKPDVEIDALFTKDAEGHPLIGGLKFGGESPSQSVDIQAKRLRQAMRLYANAPEKKEKLVDEIRSLRQSLDDGIPETLALREKVRKLSKDVQENREIGEETLKILDERLSTQHIRPESWVNTTSYLRGLLRKPEPGNRHAHVLNMLQEFLDTPQSENTSRRYSTDERIFDALKNHISDKREDELRTNIEDLRKKTSLSNVEIAKELDRFRISPQEEESNARRRWWGQSLSYYQGALCSEHFDSHKALHVLESRLTGAYSDTSGMLIPEEREMREHSLHQTRKHVRMLQEKLRQGHLTTSQLDNELEKLLPVFDKNNIGGEEWENGIAFYRGSLRGSDRNEIFQSMEDRFVNPHVQQIATEMGVLRKRMGGPDHPKPSEILSFLETSKEKFPDHDPRRKAWENIVQDSHCGNTSLRKDLLAFSERIASDTPPEDLEVSRFVNSLHGKMSQDPSLHESWENKVYETSGMLVDPSLKDKDIRKQINDLENMLSKEVLFQSGDDFSSVCAVRTLAVPRQAKLCFPSFPMDRAKTESTCEALATEMERTRNWVKQPSRLLLQHSLSAHRDHSQLTYAQMIGGEDRVRFSDPKNSLDTCYEAKLDATQITEWEQVCMTGPQGPGLCDMNGRTLVRAQTTQPKNTLKADDPRNDRQSSKEPLAVDEKKQRQEKIDWPLCAGMRAKMKPLPREGENTWNLLPNKGEIFYEEQSEKISIDNSPNDQKVRTIFESEESLKGLKSVTGMIAGILEKIEGIEESQDARLQRLKDDPVARTRAAGAFKKALAKHADGMPIFVTTDKQGRVTSVLRDGKNVSVGGVGKGRGITRLPWTDAYSSSASPLSRSSSRTSRTGR